MRLAISNIAWPSGEDERAAALLQEQGAEGVELAPTKIWPQPLEATPAELRAYRDSWERRGIRIVALQALLFGRSDLVLFEDPGARRRMLDYLQGIIRFAAALGAEALVFGSPKNRLAGERPRAEVDAIALDAFRELGDDANQHQIAFCIEPNPSEYGCDYITTVAEGIGLVERVASPGFGLHLDTGGMTLTHEPWAETFARVLPHWRHFHASEPFLAPVGSGAVDHRAAGAAACRAGYDRWVSIEMKPPEPPDDWPRVVETALRTAREAYLVSAPSE